MDWNNVQSNWKRYRELVRKRWDKLSSEDLDKINGDRHHLASKIKVQYHCSKAEAEQNIDNFVAELDKKQHVEKTGEHR